MALIEYLSEIGIQVLAVVRGDSARKSQIIESDSVARVECALSEMAELPQRVREAVRRKNWDESISADAFYHFAWDGTFGNYRNDMYLQNQNIKYALEAVDAAAILGCGTFVGSGSQAEYGRYEGKLNADVPAFPDNGYGMAKLCAGQMTRIWCEKKGIRHIWPRILSVYGPYDGSNTMIMNVIGKILKGERASCTKGEQTWDYLYSKDVAKMLYLLGILGVSGKIYCLGSGIAKPLREYIEIMRDIINPDAEIGFGDVEYSEKQVMHLCADISELQKDTGYVNEFDFEEGIKETIMWYKSHVYGMGKENNKNMQSMQSMPGGGYVPR